MSVVCKETFVDEWKVIYGENIENHEATVIDTFVGKKTVMSTESEKYLGSWISCSGGNMKTITERKNKATGIMTRIMNILENVYFGGHFF